MGIRVLIDDRQNMACLYDSVTDWTVGPVAYGDNAPEILQEFLRTLPHPINNMSRRQIEDEWIAFCTNKGRV